MKIRAEYLTAIALVALGSCSSPTSGPGPDTPASIEVTPSAALMVSIGDTVDFTATVRNGAAQSIGAAVGWASSAPAVVKIDANGRAVAVANGVAAVTATAGPVSGAAAVTVEQVADSVAMAGDAQGADVLAPLDSVVALTLLDARGNPVSNAPVSLAMASGGGSVTPTSLTTGADGSASAVWTLGPDAGIQELEWVAGGSGEVTGAFTANAYPLGADTLVVFSGDGQTELVSTGLPEPLRVQALDSLGNGVPDVPVVFIVDGDAALEATEVATDLDGVASVALTLGSALGTYAVGASVPPEFTATGEPLVGSPVALSAEAVPYVLAPVVELTVGDTVTVTGTGFHPSLESNLVTVGGIPAPLLGGSQTELIVEVPSFGCTPQRAQTLEVSRTGGLASQDVTVTPRGALALEVGERAILSDAEDFCLQFLSGVADEYLVGLTSTNWFDGAATFAMSGLDSTGPFPAPPAPSALAADAPSGVELRLRAREVELVSHLSASTGSGPSSAPATAPPVEGDMLDLRLPDLRGDACLDYVPVSATVFSIGTRLALATSAALPAPSNPFIAPLLDAMNNLHMTFGNTGIDLIMGFLGLPAGWDAESRITVVIVPEVAAMGVPAFASAVDQLPRSVCPSSNEGNYVYVALPELTGTDLERMIQLGALLEGAPADLAHHIAHLVQWTRRLSSGGNLLPSWVAEGQAEMIVEHVGLTLSGLGSRQNLGSAALAFPGLAGWIEPRFERLALFHGWDGATGKVAGAPEGCSLFGFTASVCAPEAGPGAAWSFMRYLSDRFSPTMTGGEPGLHQALIDLEPTSDLVGQIEEMLGFTLPELMVDWAATLYTDERLTPAQAPDLQMTSWKLDELIPAGPMRLAPAPFGFADFTRLGALVGGGTAYSLVSSATAHGPLAVSVRDGAGGTLAAALRPRVWVVRMR